MQKYNHGLKVLLLENDELLVLCFHLAIQNLNTRQHAQSNCPQELDNRHQRPAISEQRKTHRVIRIFILALYLGIILRQLLMEHRKQTQGQDIFIELIR